MAKAMPRPLNDLVAQPGCGVVLPYHIVLQAGLPVHFHLSDMSLTLGLEHHPRQELGVGETFSPLMKYALEI